MYYYAYLDDNDIVVNIYSLPSIISDEHYILIDSNDTSLIGLRYNRETEQFEEVVYYYAVLNDKDVVVNVTQSESQVVADNMISIDSLDTSLIGKLYDRTTNTFVVAPANVVAELSTSQINYKDQDVWLDSVLDGLSATVTTLDGNIDDVATDVATLETSVANLNTAVDGKANASHTHTAADITGLPSSVDAYSKTEADERFATISHTHSNYATTTDLEGKANSSHTHTANDISGVVKTVNGTSPDTSGNVSITISSNEMSANDILTSIKTVDGANSGLDADTLDGIEASGFATATHNHDSVYATSSHTHSQYLTDEDLTDYATTTAMNTALSNKADTSHTHSQYVTDEDLTSYVTATAMNTALSGKADTSHTHSQYVTDDDLSDYATTTAMNTALNGKADSNHTHSGYLTSENLTGYATTTAMNTALADKSDTTHTHTGVYAPVDHNHDSDYATASHNHDSAYATVSHTHDGYATTTAMNSALSGKADTSHTHSDYVTTTDMNEALSSKADSSHTHDGYVTTTAMTDALSNKADTSHTHDNYVTTTSLDNALSSKADTSHTHSEYASTSHTHSGYASSSHTHTTISNDLNITGVVKANGQQVLFNSGSMITLSTNNYPTVVAGTQVTLNGDKVYAPNIYPRNTGTFYLGAQSNRWSGIYSKVAVNVSSDERLKENIEDIDEKQCVDFISGLDVKSFNYKGDDKEKIGVIAQQLIATDKDLSKYFVEQGEDGYYGVTTSDLVFPLIKAVQSLQKEVEQLKGNS